MNDELINKVNMVGTCLTLAKSPDYVTVWTGQEPAAFATDLAALDSAYGAASVLASRYQSAITGAADDKDVAETILEQATFVLARALANFYKKTGDLTNRAKVAVRIGAIQKMRDQALYDYAMEVRDLGQAASTNAEAVSRGVTAARVSTLTAAIAAFGGLMNQPRSGIANKSALRRELETVVAGLVEDVTDLDDLVMQFDATEAGRRFIAAWKAARIIVDAGHGPGEEEPVNPTSGGTPPTA